MQIEKGFSPIILLFLVIVTLGTLFLIYQYFTNSPITSGPALLPPLSSSLPKNDVQKDKILYVSKKGDISTASPDGKNITPVSSDPMFNRGGNVLAPLIIGVSPDSSKMLVASHVKYDPANPDNPDYKIGNSQSYYIASLDGKNIKKIDLTKFAKLGPSMVYLSGWSVDGGKIAFYGTIPQPEGPAKTMFGDYDPVSEEIRPIYTADSPKAGALMYYDSQSGTLVFNSQLAGSPDPTGKSYKVDLQTQEMEEFNKPTLVSDNKGYEPYFISSSSDFSAPERKSISVYSYDRPNIPVAKIDLEDDPKSNFSNIYFWSPQYNYFAIGSGYSGEKNGRLESHRKLNIYTKDGKKVLSKEVEAFDFYSGSLFSPDESKFLMVGITTQKDGAKIDIPVWQVIDIKTGEQLTDRIFSEDLGLYTAMWLK